jgi:hypothetical protein
VHVLGRHPQCVVEAGVEILLGIVARRLRDHRLDGDHRRIASLVADHADAALAQAVQFPGIDRGADDDQIIEVVGDIAGPHHGDAVHAEPFWPALEFTVAMIEQMDARAIGRGLEELPEEQHILPQSVLVESEIAIGADEDGDADRIIIPAADTVHPISSFLTETQPPVPAGIR